MERTLIILKPEAMDDGDVCPQLLWHLLSFAYDSGGKVLKAKVFEPDQTLVESHYADHVGKDFFRKLVHQITDKVVFVAAVEGRDVVKRWRALMGPFREGDRQPGTIRGDFMKPGDPLWRNFAHGSDSAESAEREIAVWFPDLTRTV